MKKITVYGKGRIGKPTTTSSLSTALAAQGLYIMRIKCDPKVGSTENLMAGKEIPTVPDQVRQGEKVISLGDVAFWGCGNIAYVESRGSTPEIGYAGRGIITTFGKLGESEAHEVFQPDIVFYDVLGDVVYGEFAMSIRGGYADHVIIVTSGEVIVLSAVNNVAHAIHNFGKRDYAKLVDFIQNSGNAEGEDERMRLAAEKGGTGIPCVVPRDRSVQLAENQGMTVTKAYPDSPMATCYRALADKVLEVTGV